MINILEGWYKVAQAYNKILLIANEGEIVREYNNIFEFLVEADMHGLSEVAYEDGYNMVYYASLDDRGCC